MPKKINEILPELTLVDSKTVGERISDLRKAKGLTQLELANKIGLKRTTLADYESNRSRIFSEIITRISIALEVSSDRVLGLKEQDQAQEAISLRYTKRIKEIESLSEYKRRLVLKALDDSIKANKD